MPSIGQRVSIRDEATGDLLWNCVPDIGLIAPDTKTFFKNGGNTYKIERIDVELTVLDSDTGLMQGECDIYVSIVP